MHPKNKPYADDHSRSWFWSALQQFGGKGIAMVSAIILARLLAPEDFGIFALVSIPLVICQQIIDGGIAQRLLQQKEIEERHLSTLFWANFGITILMIGLILGLSGIYGELIGEESIRPLLCASTLTLLIFNLAKVCEVRLTRAANFKTMTKISLLSNMGGLLVAVVCAFQGLGVWTLVVQQLTSTILNTAILQHTTQWRLGGKFEKGIVVDLYRFGLPLCLAQVYRAVASNLSSFLIGQRFSVSQLGFVTRGRLIPNHFMTASATFMSRVNLPALARVQDDGAGREKLFGDMLNRGVATGILLSIPMLFFPAVFVEILLGEKWLPGSVFFSLGAVFITTQIFWILLQDLLKSCAAVKTVSSCSLITSCLQLVGVIGLLPFGVVWVIVGDLLGRVAGCILITTLVLRRKLVKPGVFGHCFLQVLKVVSLPLLLATVGTMLPVPELGVCLVVTLVAAILIMKVQGFLAIFARFSPI
jgi:O-antigen/teichoic acid export membrane protein